MSLRSDIRYTFSCISCLTSETHSYLIASTNQRVIDVECVIAVPTQTAKAPASKAAFASSGVWTRPSQKTGTSPAIFFISQIKSSAGPSQVGSPGRFPANVVATMSQPKSIATRASSTLEQSAIIRVLPLMALTVSAKVEPSGLGRDVASQATISLPASMHFNAWFAPGVM